MNKLKVSIVIPAYNEEKYIGRCLNAIAKQEYNNYEIILVDNGSTDKTIQIAAEYGVNVIQERFVNISGLRNLGASRATGEVLAFVDADCIPVKNWLFNGVLRLQDRNVGVTGAACSIPPKSTWVEKAWYSSKPKGVRGTNFLGTANMFVWKELFDKLSGFNEELSTGEDYEFCYRVKGNGYKVVSDDNIKVFHLRAPKTLLERLKKEIWYGMETETILKINKFYLPFYTSLIYLFIIVFLLISVSWGHYLSSLLSIGTILLLLMLISLYRCYINKQFKYYFYMIPIYLFYLTGRSIALIYFLRKKKRDRNY